MTEVVPIEQQLKAAYEELHCIELERDQALKALHTAEWQLHAVGKEGTDNSHPNDSGSVNLEAKFHSIEVLDAIKIKLEKLEANNVAAEAREKALAKRLEACQVSVSVDDNLKQEYEAKISILMEKVVSLEREVAVANASSQSKIDDLTSQINTFTKNLKDEKEAGHIKLQGLETEHVVKLGESQSKIDDLTKQINTLVEELKTERTNATDRLQSLEREYSAKLEVLSNEKSSLLSDLQNIKNENATQIIVLEEASQQKMSSLSEQIENYEKETKIYQEKFIDYEKKISLLEQEKEVVSQSLQQSQVQLEKEKKKNVDTKAQEAATIAKLGATAKAAEVSAKESLAQLQGKCDASEAALKSQVSALELKASKLAEQLIVSAKETADLHSKLASAESTVQAQEQRLEKLSKLSIKLQSTEVENAERSRQLESQLASLQEREAEVTRREENNKRTNEGLEKKVSTLKSSKQALQIKSDAAEARIMQLEVNLQAAEKTKVKADGEIARLMKKIEDLTAKYTSERPREAGASSTETPPASASAPEKEKEKTEKVKVATKPAVSEKTSLTVAAVREELAKERLHKFIAIISSVSLLIVVLSMICYNIMSDLSSNKRH